MHRIGYTLAVDVTPTILLGSIEEVGRVVFGW